MGLFDLVDGCGFVEFVSLVVFFFSFFFLFFEVALVAVGVVACGGRRCLCRFGMWVCLIWWMDVGLLNLVSRVVFFFFFFFLRWRRWVWVCAGGGCPVVVWVVPVMDVGLCRWWVWDVGLCWFGLSGYVFFFFFEVALVAIGVVAGGGRRCLCRWWPLVMMMKIVIGMGRR